MDESGPIVSFCIMNTVVRPLRCIGIRQESEFLAIFLEYTFWGCVDEGRLLRGIKKSTLPKDQP